MNRLERLPKGQQLDLQGQPIHPMLFTADNRDDSLASKVGLRIRGYRSGPYRSDGRSRGHYEARLSEEAFKILTAEPREAIRLMKERFERQLVSAIERALDKTKDPLLEDLPSLAEVVSHLEAARDILTTQEASDE